MSAASVGSPMAQPGLNANYQALHTSVNAAGVTFVDLLDVQQICATAQEAFRTQQAITLKIGANEPKKKMVAALIANGVTVNVKEPKENVPAHGTYKHTHRRILWIKFSPDSIPTFGLIRSRVVAAHASMAQQDIEFERLVLEQHIPSPPPQAQSPTPPSAGAMSPRQIHFDIKQTNSLVTHKK